MLERFRAGDFFVVSSFDLLRLSTGTEFTLYWFSVSLSSGPAYIDSSSDVSSEELFPFFVELKGGFSFEFSFNEFICSIFN